MNWEEKIKELDKQVVKAAKLKEVAIAFVVFSIISLSIGIIVLIIGAVPAGGGIIGVGSIISFALWITTLVRLSSIKITSNSDRKTQAIILMSIVIFPLLPLIGAIIAAKIAQTIVSEKIKTILEILDERGIIEAHNFETHNYDNKVSLRYSRRRYDHQGDLEKDVILRPRKRYNDTYSSNYNNEPNETRQD